jgi:hypothetical protein
MDNEKFITDINKFGYTVLAVEASDYLPSFAYTVGLWKNCKHPEVISFGLTVKNLNILLNTVGKLVMEGEQINTNKIYQTFFDNSKVEFIEVDKRNISDYFGYAIDLYQTKDFPALQLVWTDRNNLFPWESDFEKEFLYKQPLLDRNADFKFRESVNLGVFTTRQCFESDQPILYVAHDFDGDWQFLTKNPLEEDAIFVSLEEIIIHDKTLNEVFDLDYGEEATRKFIGDNWTRRTT